MWRLHGRIVTTCNNLSQCRLKGEYVCITSIYKFFIHDPSFNNERSCENCIMPPNLIMHIHLCLHHEAVVIVCKSNNAKNCLVDHKLLLIAFGASSSNRAKVKTIDEFWNLSSLQLYLIWEDYCIFLSLETIALINDESNLSELALLLVLFYAYLF